MMEKDPSEGERTEQDALDLNQEAIRDLDVDDDDGDDIRGGAMMTCPRSCRYS